MLVKVVAVQARLGQPLSLAEKILIFKQRPEFVCLPEYWLLDHTVADHARAALRRVEYTDYLSRLSEELSTTLVAGTIVEADGDRLYNCSLVIRDGTVIGKYRKRHLMPGEQNHGLEPGAHDLVIDVDGVRVGVMICADVFHPEWYDQLAAHQADIVFVPTASPLRPDDSRSEKANRDRTYFGDGSRRSGAYVVKVCGVGELFGRPLQGRSLIAAPWGIIGQVASHDEANERIMSQTLDIDEVREFRGKQKQRQSRAH